MERVKLPNCPQLFNRYPHQLSGGQKQRIMIAMAICNHPKLLIADEPTTALDVTVQYEIIRLLQQLQADFGLALLFITHDLALAKMIADDFLILEAGQVVHNTLDFRLPEPKKSKEEVQLRVPHLLEVKKLDVFYPGKESFLGKQKSVFKAVNQVSFFIDKGETLGLVGESGCGKSTLSKSILGLQEISGGAVYFDGQDITHLSSEGWRKQRRDIQIIFQDPYAALNPRIKIGDAIKEPMLVHHIASGSADLEKKMEHLLEAVQLPKNAKDKYPHEFSGGQRQRICIARALAVNPRLIICDESVSALDVKIQAQILRLLKTLQAESQLTYLFITHDLNVVRSVSDRIMVMEQGRIVESGNTERIMLHPQEDYTKRLLAAVPAR
jgi:peptide/nickel transport system ATP-binding protein